MKYGTFLSHLVDTGRRSPCAARSVHDTNDEGRTIPTSALRPTVRRFHPCPRPEARLGCHQGRCSRVRRAVRLLAGRQPAGRWRSRPGVRRFHPCPPPEACLGHDQGRCSRVRAVRLLAGRQLAGRWRSRPGVRRFHPCPRPEACLGHPSGPLLACPTGGSAAGGPAAGGPLFVSPGCAAFPSVPTSGGLPWPCSVAGASTCGVMAAPSWRCGWPIRLRRPGDAEAPRPPIPTVPSAGAPRARLSRRPSAHRYRPPNQKPGGAPGRRPRRVPLPLRSADGAGTPPRRQRWERLARGSSK